MEKKQAKKTHCHQGEKWRQFGQCSKRTDGIVNGVELHSALHKESVICKECMIKTQSFRALDKT